MILRVKGKGLESSSPRLVIHQADMMGLEMSGPGMASIVQPKEMRVRIGSTSTLLDPGEVLVPDSVMILQGLGDGDLLELRPPELPRSVKLIKKTMDRVPLSSPEMFIVLEDIMQGRISKGEIAAWLTALYVNGLSEEEVYDLTLAMTGTGDVLEFERGPVFDFHSIGGVPGNKVTPIVVSIAAEAGLLLPKTSSRAISSACGTADFVEVFCDIELGGSRIKEISQRTGGVFAWGGAMNLTPVNGLIIETQYPLGIDPQSIMMASIMSKKMAMGAKRLVMDIPMGPGTKIGNIDDATRFAQSFISLGKRLGMEVECAVTDGRQPLGTAIGPALEARECIRALECERGLKDVVEKASELAGMLLEMSGMHDGTARAMEILQSGRALAKFREIVSAQGGDPGISSDDISVGKHSIELFARRSGYVNSIANKSLVAIARTAGAPRFKGGGIILHKKIDQRVEEGELLMTLYSDNKEKLDRAMGMAMKMKPLWVGGLVLEKKSHDVRGAGISRNGHS